MDKKDNLDKILATASSAINKREELSKLMKEKEEILRKADEIQSGNEAVLLIDKGLLLSKKMASFGKNEDSMLVLSKLLELAKRLKLDEDAKNVFNTLTSYVRKLVKESLVWENYNKAYIYIMINEILENYGIEGEISKIEEEILKVEANLTRVKGKLLDAKNDALSLVINPNKELINAFRDSYKDLFTELKAETELNIIINLLSGLTQ